MKVPARPHSRTTTRIAYGSMEFAVHARMPIYSGGLGVLAGDHLKTAADMGVPLVGYGLLLRDGFFTQQLGADGWQTELPVSWRPEEQLRKTRVQVDVPLDGRNVKLAVWRKDIMGVGGFTVPLYLLDAHVEGNADQHRALTGQLYGGDHDYRLRQEILLGIGGYRALQALGYSGIDRYHMNEGHCAFVTLPLLDRYTSWRDGPMTAQHWALLQPHCVFTTHTPLPAGHDRFQRDKVRAALGDQLTEALFRVMGDGDEINTTKMALRASAFTNAVSVIHRGVTRGMFTDFNIQSITNGVHAPTWTSAAIQALYDRKIPIWRQNTSVMRQITAEISPEEFAAAHWTAKTELLAEISRQTGTEFVADRLTIGFARRAAKYKRHHLIYSDLDRLIAIARAHGPLQFVYSGKAHPKDGEGKEEIKRVFAAREELHQKSGGSIDVVFLENYDMELARLIVGGVDVWLNTPERGQEASGTSGMKAAFNGVPSLSVLDGWWLEGYVPGKTGWAIGKAKVDGTPDRQYAYDREELYAVLPEVLQTYYRDPAKMMEMRLFTAALNGEHFSMQRVMHEYLRRAYRL